VEIGGVSAGAEALAVAMLVVSAGFEISVDVDGAVMAVSGCVGRVGGVASALTGSVMGATSGGGLDSVVVSAGMLKV
jgi:hypothetical protein